MRKELRIIRRNPNKLPLEELREIPLEKREYEACRRSKFNGQEWNSCGRHYNIRGLFNLVKTPGVNPFYKSQAEEELIKRDLKDYESIIMNKEGVSAAKVI